MQSSHTQVLHPLIQHALEDNNIQLNPQQIEQCCAHLSLLNRWNQAFNLSAITKPQDQVYKHLIDSLTLLPYMPADTHALDVGSGAGFPGIPMAIARPNSTWHLIDANEKKVRFLTHVAQQCALKNITPQHQRIETLEHQAGFDSITCRAFSSIAALLLKTKHLLKPEGCFILMKGKYPEDEIKDLPPGFYIKKIDRIDIKGTNLERHIIIIHRN
jgi:16S rRNA (guanine527-N7)-methyltransferase